MRFIFLCVGLFSASVFAKEAFTVKQLVSLAVEKHSELKALHLETDSVRHMADQSRRWENPSLQIGAEEKTEPEGRTHFTKYGLSQNLPSWGRPSALRSRAQASVAIKEAETSNAALVARSEMARLIYEFQIAKEKAAHAKERFERFKTVNAFMHSRVFASPQKKAEATIVRSKLLILGRELKSFEADRQQSWNRLNLYLGLSTEPDIKITWSTTGASPDLESLLQRARQNSPALRLEAAKVLEGESELRLEQAESWPALSVSAEYVDGRGAVPEKSYGLGLSFPIPILDGNRSATRGARARLEAQNERRNFALKKTEEGIRSAFVQYESARKSIESLKVEELAVLERQMESLDRDFKRGQVDLLTYIEADAEHFECLNAVYDSQLDFLLAQSELYNLAGQVPPVLE